MQVQINQGNGRDLKKAVEIATKNTIEGYSLLLFPTWFLSVFAGYIKKG